MRAPPVASGIGSVLAPGVAGTSGTPLCGVPNRLAEFGPLACEEGAGDTVGVFKAVERGAEEP